MDFVSAIDDAHGWFFQRGTYKQAQLYRRGQALFAKWGGGYIRLRANGTTSLPTVIWKELDAGALAHIAIEKNKDPLLLAMVEPIAIAA